MIKTRVIPCLDVKDGRVVKGVNFVALRDAGDPVEQAAAIAETYYQLHLQARSAWSHEVDLRPYVEKF